MEYTIPPDPRIRLHQLLSKDYLSNIDIEEAYDLTKEIGLKDEEIPLRLHDQQIIKGLSIELQKIRDERKLLQLQFDIYQEKNKVNELKTKRGTSSYNNQKTRWCKECNRKEIWCDEHQDWEEI